MPKRYRKAKIGRKPKPATAEQVEHLAGCGFLAKDIAKALGIHRRTLDRRFKDAYHRGKLNARESIRTKVIEVAKGTGEWKQARFALACLGDRVRMARSEKVAINNAPTIIHEGPDPFDDDSPSAAADAAPDAGTDE